MVVLIDEGTAAGAEIVAAALKDHHRASLVGQTTFGRGTIQTIRSLQGAGAIKYTSAFWVTPAGARIQDVGVSPQFEVAEGADRQSAIEEALRRLN